MTFSDLQIGAVFLTEWDDRPIRIIAFDEETVMYDCWWPHVPGWGITALNRSVSYYRLPTPLLLSKGQYLRTEAYTETELQVHRPDLPFSFARFAELEWPDVYPTTPDDFPGSLCKPAELRPAEDSLNAARIFLRPYGPKGSPKPEVLIEAENGTSFTVKEILWRSAQLQAPFLSEGKLTKGIGVYRSGIRRMLPTYYIWGSKSMMEQ